jgi:hypothetical protein
MFGLAIFDSEGERHYWTGGEIWDADPDNDGTACYLIERALDEARAQRFKPVQRG